MTGLESTSWLRYPDEALWQASGVAEFATNVEITTVAPATLTVRAVGVWRAYVNDADVSDEILETTQVHSGHRLPTRRYDVTPLLRPGTNTVRLDLAGGPFEIADLPGRYTKLTGRQSTAPRFACRLDVDGATVVSTDEPWQVRPSSTTVAHWYAGESLDLRADEPWRTAVVEAPAAGDPVEWARQSPPIRIVARREPVAVREAGLAAIVDFGQNTAALPRLTAAEALPAGTVIEMWPSEYETAGWVDQHSTGEPVYDSVVSAGEPFTFAPRFGYHGFRYLGIRATDPNGRPRPVPPLSYTSEQVMADLRQVGSFTCSDDRLDRLYALIVRAAESNLMPVPTDCPHREKLGWLEQDFLVFEAVANRWDFSGIARDMIQHMADAQTPEGLIPDTAPEQRIFPVGFRDDVNWGSAIWHLPDLVHRYYGTREAAEACLEPGLRYLDYIESQMADGLLDHGLGDWITLEKTVPRPLVASYGYARMMEAVGRVGALVGRDDLVARAEAAGGAVRERLAETYLRTGSGPLVADDEQGSLALAAELGLGGQSLRTEVVRRLIERLERDEYQIRAGEIALPALIRVLSGAGRDDLIHRLLTQAEHPGYQMMLADGCTALAEHWTGVGSRASANHFMLGYPGAWLTSHVAGLRQAPGSSGWRSVEYHPGAIEGIDHAEASYEGSPGRHALRWERSSYGMDVQIEVPAGTTAVLVAGTERRPLSEGTNRVTLTD